MGVRLVKYNYDSFPEDWKKENSNPFEGIVFACLGEVKNIKGHSYCTDIKTGFPYILDTDNLLELTEDEL